MNVRVTGLAPGPHGFHLVSLISVASVICGFVLVICVSYKFIIIFFSCLA